MGGTQQWRGGGRLLFLTHSASLSFQQALFLFMDYLLPPNKLPFIVLPLFYFWSGIISSLITVQRTFLGIWGEYLNSFVSIVAFGRQGTHDCPP